MFLILKLLDEIGPPGTHFRILDTASLQLQSEVGINRNEQGE